MSARRVAITGIGAITPIGSGATGLYQGLRRGEGAIHPITRFDASPFRSRVAAEVRDFDSRDYVSVRRARRLDQCSAFALAASLQAVEDSCLSSCFPSGDSSGVFIGSALGGVAYAEEQHARFGAEGPKGVDPLLALSVFGGAAASNVAIELGITGPCLGNANSCASGAIAIGEACRAIRHGEIDVALAGGSEAPLAPLTFGAFALIKAMSTRNDDPKRACCPFDVERTGFVMAEGAAVLVLEELGHARRRDARVYAEVLGYGHTNDAYHMTAPRPDGSQAARAMTLALKEARLEPQQIGYVNAHASSSKLNDPVEAAAIRRALGEFGARVPVSGTKGLYGHALGATGAIEAAISALAIKHRWLPPTYGLRDKDPLCDVRCVEGAGLDVTVDYVITNAFGFGGINAALALGRV